MLNLLLSLLDAFWLILLVVWNVVVTWGFWLMRASQRLYRERWRSALKIAEEVQVENERIIGERDEMTRINADLLNILDASEERWSALEAEQQARADAARAILKRAVEQQREERDRKQAEGAARLMARRTNVPGEVTPFKTIPPGSGAEARDGFLASARMLNEMQKEMWTR